MDTIEQPRPYDPARRVRNTTPDAASPRGWHTWHPATFHSFDERGLIPNTAVAYCGATPADGPMKPSTRDPMNIGEAGGVSNNCSACTELLDSRKAFAESWQRSFREKYVPE